MGSPVDGLPQDVTLPSVHVTNGGGATVFHSIPPIRDWWQSPEIWRHINSRLGASGSAHPNDGFHRLIARHSVTPRKNALSVDCADGAKELRLLLTGCVEHIELYSRDARLIERGRAEATLFGLSERVAWHLMEAELPDVGRDHDLIYWNGTLHVQNNIDRAIAWSLDCLQDDGLFAMNGYVGPAEYQWTDHALRSATLFRNSLPQRFLLRPEGGSFERTVERPPPRASSSQSDQILPILKARLPNAEVVPTGGYIYGLGLQGIVANLDEVRDHWVFASALLLDLALSDLGHFHFAAVVGEKGRKAPAEPA